MPETDLGLWYPGDTDAPDGPTQIEKLAKKADERLQSGGLGAALYRASVTRTGTAFGSYTEPLKIELPKVKARQMIRLSILLYLRGTASATTLRLVVGGNASIKAGAELTVVGGTTTTKSTPVKSAVGGFTTEAEVENTALGGAFESLIGVPHLLGTAAMELGVGSSEAKPFAIEIQGKLASGTSTIQHCFLMAHLLG